jgi:hypothetical protein
VPDRQADRADLQPRAISDDEYVTHYGSRMTGQPVFRDHLRQVDRGALSVIAGKVTPARARALVRFADPDPTKDDGARYALARDLRQAGFTLTHAPSARNPDHSRVSYPAGEWNDAIAGIFNACFGDPEWHEEPEGGPE